MTPGQITSGIDPETGKVHLETVHEQRSGGGRYNAVPQRQFIDGVFVPNSTHGANVVNSAGHKFEFPKASGGYFSDVSSNPYVLWAETNAVHPVYLNRNATESSASLPLILMHSNAGITFDLNKIRQYLPNMEIDRFTATCGVSKSVDTICPSEFWVLVDGVCVFHHVVDKADSQVMEIDIPIAPEQKFLTLVTTDGDDKYYLDWCVFEQPKLHLTNNR